MAVDVSSPVYVPNSVRVGARPAPAAPPDGPDGPVGAGFVASAPWALLAAAWGAWLGSMVESAVESGPESRVAALAAGPLLALLGAALAFAGSVRHGTREAAGRALIGALTFAWQGAWLGALVAGGFAAAGGGLGGAWVIVVAVGAALLGGLVGLGVGLRLFGRNLTKVLNGVVWGGVVGGFAASFLWSAPALSASSASPDPVAASAAFGPAADWIWRTVGAAPLVLAALLWWVRWMREERVKGKDGTGWGLGATALLFVAAMAAGLGAIVGGLTQIGLGFLVYHVRLAPTAGTWLGALVALFFWGLKQQAASTRRG